MDTSGKNRNLQLCMPLKTLNGNECASSPSLRGATMYSPVTDLAMNFNLCELTAAGYGGTPKRRLSLSSNGSTPTPTLCPKVLDRQLSIDAGCCMDSPSPLDDSPFIQERFGHLLKSAKGSPSPDPRCQLKSSAIERFRAMPIPFCGFDPSPTGSQDGGPEREMLTPEYKSSCDRSPSKVCFPIKWDSPRPTEDDLDKEDSQDSGLCMENNKEKVLETDFRFTEPLGPPPRRMRLHTEDSCSPKSYSPSKCRKSPRPVSAPVPSLHFSSPHVTLPLSESPVRLRQSSLTLSPEADDGDDGFLDITDMDEHQATEHMPAGFSSLFTAPDLSRLPSCENTPGRKRSLENIENEEPKESLSFCSRRGLFRSPSAPRLYTDKAKSFDLRSKPFSFKRSEPCRDGDTPVQTKRRKSVQESPSNAPEKVEENRKQVPVARRLQRSQSEALIKSAMSRGDEQPDLIGDFSKPYCLPLIRGKHQDLKSISPETLSRVLRNEYAHVVEKALIVDCRYPYEYEGGHIEGAKNIYTKDTILDEFLKNVDHQASGCHSHKRNILIFHCEFSSERAPNLSRFLRNRDRELNKECYPSLHYPEVYLLEGGYKAFFEYNKEQCKPQEYKPMLHQDHASDLKHFRQKSKSWAGEKGRVPFRMGLKL